MSTQPQVRCRQIKAADVEAVTGLLARGFPARPRNYWARAMATLAARGAPEGCPEFGYLLEADQAVVGVLLLIFSEVDGQLRANVSSWYVEPEHRGHAAMLAMQASKLKQVTYLNTSAATHTWPILEALGYRRYSQGQYAALPALKLGGAARVRRVSDVDASLPEYEMLRAHEGAGCLALTVDAADGPQPFIFLRRKLERVPLGAAQLVYARDTASLVACAGPLGRFLLAQGAALLICDAEGPIAGLPGRFFPGRTPRYFKGPNPPRINDLAFTEMVVFGP